MSRDLFYRPPGAIAADLIPLHHDGRYRLFYLLDWRDVDGHGEGTPWYQISTTDFVDVEEHGEMVPRGSVDDQDLYIFTGCVIEADDGFHIFYTGHNPHLRAAGRPEQAVMHAVSDDLVHWRKVPEDTFFAPADRYEPNDWRDPFVFRNEDTGEWWMLLAARIKDGPSRRRGCTALCVSKDLTTWEVRDPFWAPGLYFTHECPDLFRMGDWWYLWFSEFSERTVTRYRMARSLEGPWIAPEDDTIDGRGWYAAKTASDGERRFGFGWNATRAGLTDDGAWEWGGDVVVHEVTQRPDGTLALREPASVAAAFDRVVPTRFRAIAGSLTGDPGHPTVSAPGGFGLASAGTLPLRCRIDVELRVDDGTRSTGLWLRGSADGERGYYIRVEPDRERLVFDRWPRPGVEAFAVELERQLRLEPGEPVRLTVLVEDSIAEVYANERVVMSARMYDHTDGEWGVFVTDGTVEIARAQLAERTG